MMKEIKYEAALKQLQEIVERLESGQMDIDALGKEIKNAQTLIKMCKDKLTKTEEEINAIIS
jgi:exodeoxyribonuclease VII small subunit